MFWGCEISTGKDHTVADKELAEDEFGQSTEMLHVSNVSLNGDKKSQAGSKYKVFVEVKNQKHLIANLADGGIENYALDLYFRYNENPKFSVETKGQSAVSLTGYWESAPDIVDDDYGMGPMDMEALEEEEDADLDPVTKSNIGKPFPLNSSSLDKAKKNALKNSLMNVEDDDEFDDEEDEEEDFIPNKVSIQLKP